MNEGGKNIFNGAGASDFETRKDIKLCITVAFPFRPGTKHKEGLTNQIGGIP